jgi:hypothetical protein
MLSQGMPAQTTPTQKKNCSGLHAGIAAQLIQLGSGPSVMVLFVLLNDSGEPQPTAPESWKIVINGQELADSGYIFGNGPAPAGGYKILAAGNKFDFGKALATARYFGKPGRYRISWNGKGFQSPTTTIDVTPPNR